MEWFSQSAFLFLWIMELIRLRPIAEHIQAKSSIWNKTEVTNKACIPIEFSDKTESLSKQKPKRTKMCLLVFFFFLEV